MTQQSQIKNALKGVLNENQLKSCLVWKGYASYTTGKTGWHYTLSSGQVVFLGATLVEAIGTIELL